MAVLPAKTWLQKSNPNECNFSDCSHIARYRRGIPQGSPISPLLANLYMRRFVLGWKTLGLEQSLGSRIMTYADDLVILCRKGKAEQALLHLRNHPLTKINGIRSAHRMLASTPASIFNQNPTDSGIPRRFGLNSSRFRR
jgi:hypothetical protein